MTVLQLTNLALGKLGVTKAATDVTTPGDTTYEYLANLTYDHDLRALLRRWPWPFATKYADLVLAQGPFWDTDPTGLTLVQDWDSTATYAAGDVVRESSINYACILANSGTQPPNTTYWSTNEDDAPDYANPDWTYAYRYPSDCLFARRITEVAQGTQRQFDPTPIPFRVGRDENGLAKLTLTYMMAGVRFKVYSEDSVYKENELIVTNTRTGFEAIVTWAFETVDAGTLVKFQAEYKIPVPLIGRLAENVVVTFNDMDIRVMLQNLKSKLETLQELEKVP